MSAYVDVGVIPDGQTNIEAVDHGDGTIVVRVGAVTVHVKSIEIADRLASAFAEGCVPRAIPAAESSPVTTRPAPVVPLQGRRPGPDRSRLAMTVTAYCEADDLTEVFVGKRIVSVEMGVRPPTAEVFPGYHRPIVDGTDPAGLLTLDDGTKVYVAGNEGGCACSAGCYDLTKLNTTENVITSVKVIEPTDDNYGERSGTYSIFVVTAAEELNVAEFEGDDGNGYYGTGFHVAVLPAVVAA